MGRDTKVSPIDFRDEAGRWHIMAACGHHVIGPKRGEKVALCPNCQFLCGWQRIPIVYPERLPDDMEIRQA